MKKIIICGSNQVYENFFKNIKSDCHLIAYTDISERTIDSTLFNGTNYLKPNEVEFKEFDYLIVLYKEDEAIKKALKQFQFALDRIIVYYWFCEGTFCNAIKKCVECDLNFNGLILGMSHAQNDIQTHLLKKNIYCKTAYPSMDLFCHYMIYYNLVKQIPDKIKELKSVLIELPYYIFNYDLSRSKRTIKKRLYYFYTFNDFHNYGCNDDEKEVIIQFNNYLEVFELGLVEDEINNFIAKPKRISIKNIIAPMYRQIKNFKEKTGVWDVIREATINENKKIFEELIQCIRVNSPGAEIRVVVCPYNPIFRSIHRNSIEKMKNSFFKTVDELNINVEDYFKWSNNPFDFKDHCHLMIDAAYKLTNRLNYMECKEKNSTEILKN
ncbi:hypothetical protein [Ruminococcus albus]|uniref:Uncharacterized protein n=1 Tax=Ruminococcus albus TaxID=1264 RepID=A0A1I1RBI9_RUMAL|nr:hypothetical protein [Ruminococcus albus]SFD31635.1 hypothetical protein SAMN02910406_03649 [Ruminococcus albus]